MAGVGWLLVSVDQWFLASRRALTTGSNTSCLGSSCFPAIEHNARGLSFITKGDANDQADRNAVTAPTVRGRVVFGVPYLGSFVRAVHNPIGFAVLLVLPGILLIGQEVRSLRRERRARKASTEPWAPPPATEVVVGSDEFDFWTTTANEQRYYEELEHEVHA
jgi:hypothetical protein